MANWTVQMTMHQEQVIMWLGVEIAEKKERIAELENELVDALERGKKLEDALAKLEDTEEEIALHDKPDGGGL